MLSVHQVQSSAAAHVGSYAEAGDIPVHDGYLDLSAYGSLPDLELMLARQRYGNDEISHEEYFATMDRCLRELASRGDESSAQIAPNPTRCVDPDWARVLVEEKRPRLIAKL